MGTHKQKITATDPRHPEHEAYVAWFRGLSLKERGELLAAKCREAAEAERKRIAAGLPPKPEEPWPESTWEHLRRWAAQARAASTESASSKNDE